MLDAVAEYPLPSAGATLSIMIKRNMYAGPVLERPEFVQIRNRLGSRD